MAAPRSTENLCHRLAEDRHTVQVTEAVLGHVSGSRAGIIGVYQRHDYAGEKRAALEAWGAYVMALVEGRAPGKVVPIRVA